MRWMDSRRFGLCVRLRSVDSPTFPARDTLHSKHRFLEVLVQALGGMLQRTLLLPPLLAADPESLGRAQQEEGQAVPRDRRIYGAVDVTHPVLKVRRKKKKKKGMLARMHAHACMHADPTQPRPSHASCTLDLS